MSSYIGANASISKGILKGIQYIEDIGGNCIQIFLGSNQNTSIKYKTKVTEQDIKDISKYIKKKNLQLFIHSIYLLNFCKFPVKDKRIQYAIDNLIYDLELTEKLGGIGCVLHIGYQLDLTEDEAYLNMANNVMHVIDSTPKCKSLIILETPAGKGTQIGTSIQEFSKLWNMIDSKYYNRLGICVDTAHIFSSGRDIRSIEGIRNYLKEFNSLIGLEHLTLFHINDSKAKLNSRKDLHEGLGEGYIYGKDKDGNLNALKEIWRFSVTNSVPMILETHGGGQYDSPKDNGQYRQEIQLFRDWDKGLDTEKTFKLNKNIKEIEKPDNSKIINILKILSKCYGNQKDRIRKNVYDKAIMNLKQYDKIITSGDDVKHLPGIGSKIVEKIDEILKTGTLELLSKLEGCEDDELTKILGIGEVFAKKLRNEFGIKTIEELRKSNIELNETQKIGLHLHDDLSQKVSVNEAERIVNHINEILTSNNFVDKYKLKIELAGSLSEGTDITSSKDIDVLITTKSFRTKEKLEQSNIFPMIVDSLFEDGILTHIVNVGKTKLLGMCRLNKKSLYRHIDIRFITNTSYVYARSYYTSGRAFNIMFRAKAKKEGYKLNEWGLYDSDNNFIKVKNEKELFNILDLDYIPPNKRR